MERLSPGFMILTTCLALSMLVSCSRPAYQPIEDPSLRLPNRIEGTSDKRVIALKKQLNGAGVAVISFGQDHLISLPAAALFPEQSPHLTWRAYGLLNKVVCYLQEYRKVAITVTAFSTQYVSNQREQALTLARARSVGDYLWSQGIDSRMIFTEGAAADKPIYGYSKGNDMSANARVEITFRDAIV